ncbi:MAG TPA: radical SAM protein [Thermodesulfobacteriota bacterium]
MASKGRVLFIIHDNFKEDNVFPLGAGYLAAVLRRAGAEVSVYCMDVFHYTEEELSEYLSENSFDLICMGFMAPNFKRNIERLCRVINANKKGAWLVLGGQGPTPIPEYIIEKTSADAIVTGEGEETIVEVLQRRVNGLGLRGVNGTAYQEGGGVVVNPRRKPVQKLDSLPYPEWELFPMERYTACLKFAGMGPSDRSLPMVTTRGCINRCSFCYRMEAGIRARGLKSILGEVKALNGSYGVNYFFFADELSIVSKKKTLEFCRAIQDEGLDIMFRMDCRVDLFDDEIARALKDSGCVFLNIGFESTEQAVLDQMDKNVTVEENLRAAEIANRHGIGIGLNLIWGLPGDNEKTLRQNAEFIKRHNLYDQVRTIRPVTPYPGSPLYYKAIKDGHLTGPADFFERFKNSDLYMVNFMGIPEDEVYRMLFDVNRGLILDHYRHTSGKMEEAQRLIDRFFSLYFRQDYSFSGARTLVDNENVRKKDSALSQERPN